VALGAALAAAAAPVPEAGDPAGELARVVLVSRHGVRTPTISPAELSGWAAAPWPSWTEPPGALTRHGASLARIMGGYDRAWLSAEGVLPPTGCPAPGTVWIEADVAERTERTARALAEGIAPGCGIPVASRAPRDVDPLFHPVFAGVCGLRPELARRAILERARGGLDAVAADRADAFAALQPVLGCCAPAVCRSFGRPAGCTLPELPNGLADGAAGQPPRLTGGLAIGSDAAEILLLEFADGRPKDQVGWGRANAATIRRALGLHDAAFDLAERTPYLARAAGSALLSYVGAAVAGRAFAGSQAPEPEPRDARVVLLVGHDTNIANLGGMLGASWALPGYPANETPPAGALVFELRRDAAGRQTVSLEYVAQSLEQMHDQAPLSIANPPLRVPLRIPGCANGTAGRCTLDEFEFAVARAVEPACLPGPRPTPPPTPGSPSDATSATPSETPVRFDPPGR
jgi:4-phytase/acid phosphatase